MRTLLLALGCATATATATFNEFPDDPVAATTALIGRVLPGAADQFELALLPAPEKGEPAAMQLGTSPSGKVHLLGTGGVELAAAFNWYLNDYLNATYDWNTYAEGQLPTELTAAVPGYSLAFVPWEYWAKHIDWMAMQGVNMPLAFVGQEWVWAEVFKSYGLSLEDQYDFYSGPAFLPWFRMGNMKGFGGPLTQSWLDQRKALNIKMLARMRGLGMKPALSAFAGHVPMNFTAKFPTANITRSPNWANFNLGGDTDLFADVFLVEPTDPLFVEIGNKYIALQKKTYGTDHIYQADTYNEMLPPTNDVGYLKSSAQNVYAAMSGADPDAVWLMQGWLFFSGKAFWKDPQITAYLGGVEKDKMWLLDLFGDSNPLWQQTDSYKGHPFFLCTLLNFGGQQGIVGNFPRVADGFHKALGSSSISGVGITMEGIWTNYPMFESTFQHGFTSIDIPSTSIVSASTSDPAKWFTRYGTRRYGKTHPAAVQAWQQLGATIYTGVGGGFGSMISSVPTLTAPPGPPGPQPAGPAAPKGFTRRHPTDGYWNPPPGVTSCDNENGGKCTIDECAKACVALRPPGYPGIKCLAFEVYVDTPPVSGNCYLFTSLKGPFTALGPSRTYLRDMAVDESQSHNVSAAGKAPTILGLSAMEKAIAANIPEAYNQTAITESLSSTSLKQVWSLLLQASDSLGHVASYHYDLVDVGRQVIAANFSGTFAAYTAAFKSQNADTCKILAARCLEIIDDYDSYLNTDTNFMLGRWIAWAKLWGTTKEELANLEYNARNQLTLWGPTGQINDYAKKEWGGLVSTYYKNRYALLFEMAQVVVEKKVSWVQTDYTARLLREIELPWQLDQTEFPSTGQGDCVETSKAMFSKYGQQ